ncbi:hypothetical protein S40288_04805 [Stachybotrys chartarum IBT 40288]|nr:hypothetical protein S40288_04805 [Stachybotrys chartarum IBT 40288]
MTRLYPTIPAALTALLAAVVSGANEQKTLSPSLDSKNPFTDDFGEWAAGVLDHWKVPGLAIAVIDGKDVFAEGYGIATFPDTPATPETLWYGASTTKAFVDAALAQLINNGTFAELSKGWSTPISSIIRDDFVLQDEWATNHITLNDAASHRTGMTRHDKSTHRIINGRQARLRDAVRQLRHLPMLLEPRTQWSYCNLMYITLGHVVETLTAKPLGDTLKELIWDPLGMHATYFDLKDAQNAPEHLARGYYWDEDDNSYKEVRFMDVTETSAAGGVLSNVLDYAKWVKCLLYETAPFPQEVHQDIQAPRVLAATHPSNAYDIPTYGLGWIRSTFRGHVVYEHDGGMHAYGAKVLWLPGAKYGVVSFANTAVTSNAVAEILAWRLMQDKFDIAQDERWDPTPRWEKMLNEATTNLEEAIKELYPDVADPPLPPITKFSQMTGTYRHAGYGTLTLQEAPHPGKINATILLANREDMTWPYVLKFYHVSAENWVLQLVTTDVPIPLGTEYGRAWFQIGADGRAASVEYEVGNVREGREGTIKYLREA